MMATKTKRSLLQTNSTAIGEEGKEDVVNEVVVVVVRDSEKLELHP